MLPAYQRLDPHQLAIETNLGLIVHHPLFLALQQLCCRQVVQLGILRRRGDLLLGMILFQVTAQQLMQDDTGGRFLHAAQHVQTHLPRQITHAVDHAGLGAAENDQGFGQAAFGQVADQCQTISALHLQVADGDIDPPAS
ncbi:hypothetical protein D3C77_511960 [compost metagenome]